MVAVCVVGLADTAKGADCIGGSVCRRVGETVSYAVGSTERLVLFPTLLLLDLLGVVMLSTFGYEQCRLLISGLL